MNCNFDAQHPQLSEKEYIFLDGGSIAALHVLSKFPKSTLVHMMKELKMLACHLKILFQ